MSVYPTMGHSFPSGQEIGALLSLWSRAEVIPGDMIERLIEDNERLIRAGEAELGIFTELQKPRTDQS